MIISSGCRILIWQFFSFRTPKVLCHFFLASMVSDEKFVVTQVIFPCRKGIIFLWLLSRIFFVFSSQFNYSVSWNGFFFGLFYLEFAELFRFAGSCPLPNLRVFIHYFLKVLSHPTLFLLLSWDSGDMNVRYFVIVQQLLKYSLFIFFSLFSYVVQVI